VHPVDSLANALGRAFAENNGFFSAKDVRRGHVSLADAVTGTSTLATWLNVVRMNGQQTIVCRSRSNFHQSLHATDRYVQFHVRRDR